VVGGDRGRCDCDGRRDRPNPRAEARLVAGDIPFLRIVVAVVSGLVWLGSFLKRHFRRRSDVAAGREPRSSKTTCIRQDEDELAREARPITG
jgi:hypothetical protein